MTKSPSTFRGVFVTATDTGVGKTTISAALLHCLQNHGQIVHPLKPVETGVDHQNLTSSDTERLRRMVSPSPKFEAVCPYAFPEPVAPVVCAEAAGLRIDLAKILSHMVHLSTPETFWVVEGSGGILSPLTARETIRDLIAMINLPCLIIGKTSLGGVNHSLLTVESLQSSGISVCGLALNETVSRGCDPQEIRQRHTTINLIRERCPVPVFGPFLFETTMQPHWDQGITKLAKKEEMSRLVTSLLERSP